MVAGTIQPLIQGFPLPAIVGQDMVKKALLCILVSKELHGVLITGPAGTAKSTVVRSLQSITPDMHITNLPLNVSEDRLLGGLDVDYAIKTGKRLYRSGILKEANNGLLYLDEINLFEDSVIQTVLDVMESGENVVEREGVSGTHDCNFALVGSMDPSEGSISPHLLDRFDICVEMESINDRENRMEVLRRRLIYEKEPRAFVEAHHTEVMEIRRAVECARHNLPSVTLPDDFYDIVSQLTIELGIHGHRGDLAMIRTSRALAALDGRKIVNLNDLHDAADLCLQHRRSDSLSKPPTAAHNDQMLDKDRHDSEELNEIQDMLHRNESKSLEGDGEKIYDIGDTFAVINYIKPPNKRIALGIRRGKRGSVVKSGGPGRYSSFRMPSGKVKEVALVPTIRAAAPYQIYRPKGERAVVLEHSDIREKVRVRRKGTTILFLVDASGSMGARRRMVAVKGAILALLKDAYQKRDAVGLMAFRGDCAEIILSPTKSVDLAYKKLKELPTGGRTPLALGLSKATEFLVSNVNRNKDDDRVLVIISDGKANVTLDGDDPFQDALCVANSISSLPIRYVVVDTNREYPRIDRAERLSYVLGGSYFRMEDLEADNLAKSIRLSIHDQN